MLAVCVSSLPQNTATSTRCAGAASLPDLGIDAGEVDPLVEPAPDPVVAGVGNKMREAADVFVIPGFQPIAQITSIARFSPRSVMNRRSSRAGWSSPSRAH